MDDLIQSIEIDEVQAHQDRLLDQAQRKLDHVLRDTSRRNGRNAGGSDNELEVGEDGLVEVTSEVDLTFQRTECDIECPGELDLAGMFRGYKYPYWPKTNDEERLAKAPRLAPFPAIPNAYNDSEDTAEVTRRKPPPKSKRKRIDHADSERRAKRQRNQQVDDALTTEDIEALATPALPYIPSPEPPQVKGFMYLPALARDEIYRNLLLASNPIRIHGSWELVFRNQRLNLSSRILRVSKQIHHEAARILYGENTFLYLLRDGPCRVLNIVSIANNDSADPAEDAEESESDWQTNNAAPSRRRRARRGRTRPELNKDINLTTYKSYFRSIEIEAEHNRFLEDTKKHLAKAIKVFAEFDDQHPVWLRSLTIRVAPMWERQLGPHGKFTFVDFFESKSKIMDAIRSVPCDFLAVKLLTWNGSHQIHSRRVTRAQAARGDASAETPAVKKGCTVVLDMRPYHTYKGTYANSGEDIWKHDAAMQWNRKRRHGVILERLEGLEALIVKYCRDERYGDRGVPRRGEEDDEEDNDDEDEELDGAAGADFVELIDLDDEDDADYVEA